MYRHRNLYSNRSDALFRRYTVMEIVIHFIVSTIATFAFAKLFNAPTKELLYCGITGGIGWVIYFILSNNNLGVVLPNADFFIWSDYICKNNSSSEKSACNGLSCVRHFPTGSRTRSLLYNLLSHYKKKPVLQENMDLVHLRLP